MVATSTLDVSVGIVARQFGAILLRMAADAASLAKLIYGIQDGKNYGRYFRGQNPLVGFADAAGDLSSLIARSTVQLAAVAAAVDTLDDSAGDETAFGPAASAATEALRQACADPADALRLLSALTRFTAIARAGAVPSDALGQEIYLLAARAVLRLRLVAVASLIRATADYRPTSQQDAAAVRDQVGDVIDGLATICADLFDDDTADALDAARVKVVQDLDKRGADLAPVIIHEYQMPLSAKVLACRLYDDASRAGDLVARNNPPHPAFMPLTVEALAL